MMKNEESKSYKDFLAEEEKKVSDRLELSLCGPKNRSNHADFI